MGNLISIKLAMRGDPEIAKRRIISKIENREGIGRLQSHLNNYLQSFDKATRNKRRNLSPIIRNILDTKRKIEKLGVAVSPRLLEQCRRLAIV